MQQAALLFGVLILNPELLMLAVVLTSLVVAAKG
jgi:hypothetical protein